MGWYGACFCWLCEGCWVNERVAKVSCQAQIFVGPPGACRGVSLPGAYCLGVETLYLGMPWPHLSCSAL